MSAAGGSRTTGCPVRRSGLLLLAYLGALGCASPGSPRPPSLFLPAPVQDLAAVRSGDVVELGFSVPVRTTDKQPLKTPELHGSLCRQAGTGPCVPVATEQTDRPVNAAAGARLTWQDHLPPELLSGPPRPLRYRVEFRNAAGRSAGPSNTAIAAAGMAPPQVTNFAVEGSRRGVLLRWSAVPDGGEVLIERTQVGEAAPGPSHAPVSAGETPGGKKKRSEAGEVVWLQAQPGNASAAQTLDGTAPEGAPLRYVAVRRVVARQGGHTLELRSAPSAPASFTWRDVYPPPAPEGLTVLGFEPAQGAQAQPGPPAAAYAFDLIWQPVDDPHLAGYLVYRALWDPAQARFGARQRLTPQPLSAPGFHDATALPGQRYRYEVTAIDPKGNESSPAVAEGSSPQP